VIGVENGAILDADHYESTKIVASSLLARLTDPDLRATELAQVSMTFTMVW